MAEIIVTGHAWQRELFYTEGRGESALFHTYTAQGGAAQLAALLEQAAVKCPPVCMEGDIKREYLELAAQPLPSGRGSRLLVGRHAGFRPGQCLAQGQAAPAAIVWDEGWGGIEPPAEGSVLWAAGRVLPSPETMERLADRCVLVLDADVLRAAGAMISRQLSWERTATDLLWQLRHNPRLAHLLSARRLLVFFGTEGAVQLWHSEGALHAEITLLDGGEEGAARDAAAGSLPDCWAAIVFQCALQFLDAAKSGGGEGFNPLAALESARALWQQGYQPELLTAGYALPPESIGPAPANTYEIPAPEPPQQADPGFWCVSRGFGGGTLYDLAFSTVLEGLDRLRGLPRMTFGALTTVDRREIEAFQNIKNLISAYAAGDAVKPLSIAVFGAPGSGKSFGVTQIAKNILPGKVEKIEFNISQFTNADDLTRAFHQIRDVILSGKLPLVFFDEFDSDRDGRPLGWLKSFLMPMQDGRFRDGEQEHPVGRCIFVFAGGTAVSFAQFCEPLSDAGRLPGFKAAKGPDFVSRLRGTINVLGPNPADDGEQNFILRRALLLRSFCERKFGAQIAAHKPFIDHDVLRAMLLVPRYLHGARSMEAILDMSGVRLGGWDAADLPCYDQLALHVDADAFLRLVLRDVTLASYAERLGRAIHESYRAQAADDPRTSDPALEPWEQLSESLKRSNIRQAMTIEKKLRAIGCSYDAGDTPYPTVERFTDDDLLILSRVEHDLFVAERLADGWKHGAKKNTARKISPYLIPWEELPENVRQLDRDTAENLIPLLTSIGLRVYRKL